MTFRLLQNIAAGGTCSLLAMVSGCATTATEKPSILSYSSFEYPVEIDLSLFDTTPVPMPAGEDVVIAEAPARIDGAQQTVTDVTIQKNGQFFAQLPAGTLLTKVHIYRAADPYPGIVGSIIIAQMEKNGQSHRVPETDIYCGVIQGSDKYPTACFVDANRDGLLDILLVGDTGGGDDISSAVLPIGTVKGVAVDFTPFTIRPADDGIYSEMRMRVVAKWNGKKSVYSSIEYYPMQNKYAHALPFDQAKPVFKSMDIDNIRVKLSDSQPSLGVFANGVAPQFKQDKATNTVTGELIALDVKAAGTMQMRYTR